jgi:formate-dependent nitrite reductase membrane component NrfD
MNRTKLFIGVLLAGVIAPALGISGNAGESSGRIIAAMCFTLIGTGLIVREAWVSKRSDVKPRD